VPSDLGGNAGRLITLEERKKYCDYIDEAVKNGSKQALACKLVGISARTYQRWNESDEISEDKRLQNNAPVHNKITEGMQKEMLHVINQPEYSTLTPYEIVPTLLDLGIYLASESSFYRIMKQHNQLKHREKSTVKKRKKPKQLKATKPNEIYSWDITYCVPGIQH